MSETFDFVIIGAGSAGSVLANRLTASDATVCLLEAGGPDRNPFIHMPAGFIKTLSNPHLNWLYGTEPSEGTAGRSIVTPRGKTLGGSSSINGHIYHRGNRLDFDSWAQMGNRGWGYADVLPYFRRSEKRIGPGEDIYRGRDGELAVTDVDRRDPVSDAFIDAAAALGIPRSHDYNGAIHEGVGYFQRTIHRGRRASAARAFLHPVRSRPNLDIRTHAQVTQIRFEGRRAVAVRYRRGGQESEVRVRREIILAAGAIASPQILQVSGIGAPEHLNDIGVPTILALPEAARTSRITTASVWRHGSRESGRSTKPHAGPRWPSKRSSTACSGRASLPSPRASRSRFASRTRHWTSRTCRLSSRRRATRKRRFMNSTISPA